MKTVEMLKREVCEIADGSRRVFGPPGKSFTVDDDTAAALVKSGAAVYENDEVESTEETEPAVVSGEEESE